MGRGTPDHIDLTVGDYARSLPFYGAVLGELGFRRLSPAEAGGDTPVWQLADAGAGGFSIGLFQARPEARDRRHDRTAPGLHHLAFRAEGRDDVDRFRRFLVDLGAEILDPPADYPQYAPGYYAVFFTDPDGLKLELVYQPDGP